MTSEKLWPREREREGMEGEKGLQGHAYLEYQSLSLGRTRSYWPTPDAVEVGKCGSYLGGIGF